MPEYVYSIILVVVIVVVVAWWISKRKGEEWKGSLEKKKYNPGDDETPASYGLIFRTDDGKKKRFGQVNSGFFEQWEVGDRCEKKKGEFFPVKV